MSHERFLSVYTLALAPTHCDSCSYERRAALPINAFFLLRELPNIHDGSSLTDIHTFLQRIRRQGVSNQFAIRQDTAEMATPIAFYYTILWFYPGPPLRGDAYPLQVAYVRCRRK